MTHRQLPNRYCNRLLFNDIIFTHVIPSIRSHQRIELTLPFREMVMRFSPVLPLTKSTEANMSMADIIPSPHSCSQQQTAQYVEGFGFRVWVLGFRV